MKYLIFAALITIAAYAEDVVENKNIVRARLESCGGCSLNRLHEVKAFAYEDLPNYENVHFKKIPGATPELLFLNESDEVLERHQLGRLSREECNDLLYKRGFKMRKQIEL